MKQIIAIAAVIVLGIAVGGIIVGFAGAADKVGQDGSELGSNLISAEGQWLGSAVDTNPEGPGGPGEPDPYEGVEVVSTHNLGAAVVGTLYENGDLVVSGTGAMTNYTTNTAPFGTYMDQNRNIKNIIIQDGVTDIGNYAFSYCRGATSTTLEDSVNKIGTAAFSYCSALMGVYFKGNAPTYGELTFYETPAILKVYRKADAIGWPAVGARWGGGAQTRVTALW